MLIVHREDQTSDEYYLDSVMFIVSQKVKGTMKIIIQQRDYAILLLYNGMYVIIIAGQYNILIEQFNDLQTANNFIMFYSIHINSQ